MKIAIINTYTNGGAGIACLRLVAALQQAGHQVKVLSTSENPQNAAIEASISYPRWRFNFLAERLRWWFHEASKEVRFAFSLANWGHDIAAHPAIQEADIIHLHWINQGFLSLQNLSDLGKLGKPIVWTLHDMWAFTGGCHYSGVCTNYEKNCGNCHFTKQPKDKDISNQIFAQKSRIYPNLKNLQIVACSAWLANLARRSSLLKNAQIQNIANPIDTQVFQPMDKTQARQKLSLPTDKKIILFVAANVSDKRKGFEYLEKSLARLSASYPKEKLALLVIGKADEERLKKLPFAVHYLGNLNKTEQMVAAYSAADIFAMPSLEDNLPNTIMECLACATPVVAFRTGGIPEMIAHQQTGYLADYQDINDFTTGLLWALQTEENLAAAAREFVLQNYNFATISAAYTAVYERALR